MLSYILGIVTEMWIFVAVALSLNLILGFTGMFSLGHHGFYAVGAYAGAAFSVHVMPDGGILAFVLSLGAGTFFAMLAGLAIGLPCLRLRGDYLCVATLGFAEIIRQVATNSEFLGGAKGLTVPELLIPRSGDTRTTFLLLYCGLALLFLIAVFVLCRRLVNSVQGRALIAIREDEVAAELTGVNLNRTKLLVFTVASALAGLGGALYAHAYLQLEPQQFNLDRGIFILLAVVLGGSGSLSGTVLAGIVLFIVDKYVLSQMPSAIQDARQVIFALILILLMIFRPAGILGNRELSDIFKKRKAEAAHG